MRAPIHPKNPERLSTLNSFGVLDTAPEQSYDDIVDLIADICEVPIALVSLVSDDRQWFKARKGLELAETPIAQSVCAHAILNTDLIEIEDTGKDPRTADNPLLHGDEPLLFYAGMPLMAANGLPLGTLCILDKTPRRLTRVQRRAMRTLAAHVVKQMELNRALRNEETLRAEMDHRIKNSLQATSSLVRLYTRAVEDDAAREALEAVQRRVDAMSALHEQLQNSATSGIIDIQRYLDDLVGSIRATIPERVALVHTCEDITLSAKAATDLGVIVSEFIANSVKHAYPDGRSGTVTLTFATSDEAKLVLQASDDGIGSASPPTAPSRISGIGSSLVSAAASNLNGMLSHDLTADGARLSLVFDNQ